MRNLFSEYIRAGVASPQNYREYFTNEKDKMIVMYNNIWGACTDTCMSLTNRGRRIVTGGLFDYPVDTSGFNPRYNVLYDNPRPDIDVRPSGFLNLDHFARRYGMRIILTIFNESPCWEFVDINSETKLDDPNTLMGGIYLQLGRTYQRFDCMGQSCGVGVAPVLPYNDYTPESSLCQELNALSQMPGNDWSLAEGVLGSRVPGGVVICEVKFQETEVETPDILKPYLMGDDLRDKALFLVSVGGNFAIRSRNQELNKRLVSFPANNFSKIFFEEDPEIIIRDITHLIATMN